MTKAIFEYFQHYLDSTSEEYSFSNEGSQVEFRRCLNGDIMLDVWNTIGNTGASIRIPSKALNDLLNVVAELVEE